MTNPTKPILLSAAFIIITIIGCLSHEGGHWLVAKALCCNARIHYASTSVDYKEDTLLVPFFNQYTEQIKANAPFPGKEKYKALMKQVSKKRFYITLGGPLQTLLTSLLALITLLVWGKRLPEDSRYAPLRYIFIAQSTFSLRQPFNLAGMALKYVKYGTVYPTSDEHKISIILGYPWWTFTVITAVLGAGIFAVTVFKFIDSKNRLLFLSACLIGGTLGCVLWLLLLGPVILP